VRGVISVQGPSPRMNRLTGSHSLQAHRLSLVAKATRSGQSTKDRDTRAWGIGPAPLESGGSVAGHPRAEAHAPTGNKCLRTTRFVNLT